MKNLFTLSLTFILILFVRNTNAKLTITPGVPVPFKSSNPKAHPPLRILGDHKDQIYYSGAAIMPILPLQDLSYQYCVYDTTVFGLYHSLVMPCETGDTAHLTKIWYFPIYTPNSNLILRYNLDSIL